MNLNVNNINPTNQIIILFDQQTIEGILPVEMLLKVFNSLPFVESNWSTSLLVCKRWKVLFKETHLLHLFKQSFWHSSLLSKPLSHRADNMQMWKNVQHVLGKTWMTNLIKTCPADSKEQAEFIFNNMWLTSFSIPQQCAHPDVKDVLVILKEIIKVNTYNPASPKFHFYIIKPLLLSPQQVRLEIINEGHRLGYLSPSVEEIKNIAKDNL